MGDEAEEGDGDWFRLVSTSLLAAKYDPVTKNLDLRFQGGAAYRFLDVPRDVVEGLLNSPSKGKFFNRKIRPRFESIRLWKE